MAETFIYRKLSPYQKIELTRGPNGETTLYLDDAIQFVSGHDDRLYHGVLATMPARMLNGPVSALILGGGDGLAARNLLELSNVKKVKMIELDPGMIEFASTHPEMRRLNRNAFHNPR